MSPQLLAWQQAGAFFQWQNHRIFYRSAGRGPHLLLLHGYPVSSYDWHRVWADLSEHFTLIAPDMLGMGFSDKPAHHPYSIAQHAQMHDALLAHLGIRSVAVVAYDLGVSVAQEMLALRATASLLPEIRAITFLNGGICPEAYRPRLIQKLLASSLGDWLGPKIPQNMFNKTLRQLFGANTQPSPELLADFWALYIQGGGRAINHRVGRFWQDRLQQRDRLVNATLNARIPMRLINGAADPNSGWHMVMAFQRLHPTVPTLKLEGTGHWPQIEQPQRVAQEIITHMLKPAHLIR
jgi:pimeloyl-ACP methyl ester carboxylesterase